MRDDEPRTAAMPAETLIADAAGIGEFLRDHEINSDGKPAASKLGQWSWALFEAARDPNVIFQDLCDLAFLRDRDDLGRHSRPGIVGRDRHL